MGFVARMFRSKKIFRDPNRAATEEELRKILLSQYLQKQKQNKVRIIVWRAMFGVKYLENPWREKFDFFS